MIKRLTLLDVPANNRSVVSEYALNVLQPEDTITNPP